MSLIILNVDEVRRTLSVSGGAFVVHDKEVDIVRFAINSGFADIVLDGQVALRVMYQRPGETEVRAQTLTYYDTDGLHNYYDWQLSQSDLAKNGSLMVALCILDISGGEVSEWHTTPCAVRVLPTIHTDDSDEGDETITPTVAQRVAILESMIQRVASGAPIVVASTSAMTDTEQIYVLSTDGNWYYHNGTTWVSGGEYGAVATDTTLTQPGMPADAKAVGDKILSSENSVLKKINVDSQSFLINTLVAFETENSYAYLKFGGTRYSATPSLYIRGRKHKLIAIADYPDLLDTSPSGLSDCFKIPFTKSLIYDFDDDTLKIVSDSYANSNSFLIAYISSGGGLYTSNRYYADYKTEKLDPYFVPYFFVNHLSAKINKINADLNGNKTTGTYGIDTESFVFITDVHWASNKKHSPGMIKEILKKTSVSTVICGGDLINSYNPTKSGAVEEVRGFVDAITQIPCYEYYAVFGNHDSNANSNSNISIQFSRQEQYDMLYAPFASRKNVHWIWEEEGRVYQDQQTALKNDYYFDHPRTRTRYLCIDWTNPLNGSRASWVSSVLARDDNYRVVVVYHGIYSGSGDELSPEHTGIMTLIEPYKSKVVALFTGHAHADAVIDYYGDGSVPVILTSCDTFRADRMTEGTLDEQCFDVAVINYTSNLIKLTRIGRGNDREVEISLV